MLSVVAEVVTHAKTRFHPRQDRPYSKAPCGCYLVALDHESVRRPQIQMAVEFSQVTHGNAADRVNVHRPVVGTRAGMAWAAANTQLVSICPRRIGDNRAVLHA